MVRLFTALTHAIQRPVSVAIVAAALALPTSAPLRGPENIAMLLKK
jgi:hypothetical protein